MALRSEEMDGGRANDEGVDDNFDIRERYDRNMSLCRRTASSGAEGEGRDETTGERVRREFGGRGGSGR